MCQCFFDFVHGPREPRAEAAHKKNLQKSLERDLRGRGDDQDDDQGDDQGERIQALRNGGA